MDKTVGILGGGQLGRMLTEAANRMNIKTITLDAAGSPAKQISAHNEHVTGSFRDAHDIRRLAVRCDVITAEIEHVNVDALKEVVAEGKVVQPYPETFEVIQDKYLQKERIAQAGVPVARSVIVEEPCGENDVRKAVEKVGYPAMLKARREAYDGRGNRVIRNQEDTMLAARELGSKGLYVEEWVHFQMELAVMVVKTEAGTEGAWDSYTVAYPVVETVHEDSICKLVYAPARNVPEEKLLEAQDMARAAVSIFPGTGIFGVEMFLLENGSMLVNEIAPRPHNSGHYTIEACPMSQYEAHLRAVLGLPLTEKGLEADRAAVMLNILGGREPKTHLEVASKALEIPRAAVHLYGKGEGRPGRKMGHITVTAASMADAQSAIAPLIKLVDDIRAGRLKLSQSASSTKTPEKKLNQLPAGTELSEKELPVVAVTMGSDSDLNVLLPGIKLLEEFGVSYYTTITSAHRTPHRMFKFAEEAESRGIKVIIAAAGGAAHLAGMIAAISRLPIIGVPVKASTLDGLDSLLSIVQMPKGCPVATVAINNSLNAAQLAIRILALSDEGLDHKLDRYLKKQTEDVVGKAGQMEKVGAQQYSTDLK